MKHILLPIFVLFSFLANAQGLYKVSNVEKEANATLIVEGKVESQKSFWNPQHTMIYTANRVKVYKSFKGNLQEDYIEVLTQGGTVGNDNVEVSELLQLTNGSIGIFFCFPNQINLKSPTTGNQLYDVYASAQGFFQYDLYTNTASDPFLKYANISQELYPELRLLTKHDVKVLDRSFDLEKEVKSIKQNQQRISSPSIFSFSPTTVNAGAFFDVANNELTITGTGFGTFTGSAAVLFNDGNFAPGTYFAVPASDPFLSTLIVSWTNTQIKVKVPSRASTGTFIVRDQFGIQSSSPDPITVFYSILQTAFNLGGTPVVKESNLMNVNVAGGYTVFYSTNTAGNGVDFDMSPARQTFQRALNTWKEVVGFNVVEGGTTFNQQVSGTNGICTVMFDNQNTGNAPLSAGVLAVCYSFNSICTGGIPAFTGARKTKFDIVVRNNLVSSGTTQFVDGPCPPHAINASRIDLEGVIFHELGHAANLGHINDPHQGNSSGFINPAKVMHYAVLNGVKRVSPDASCKFGGIYAISPKGLDYGTCVTHTEMTPLSRTIESKDDCPLVFPSIPTPLNTSVSFNMVHTSTDFRIDPNYLNVRCDNVPTPVVNNAYYALRTNNSGSLNINVSNYNTIPAALASCTPLNGSIPVTGFRLSLYQLNSCPTNASFPMPVACRTFASNGAISEITGLSANTNYLLYVEGIENTKATFDLTFLGSALPIKLSSFTGEVDGNANLLKWVAESVINVRKIIIEKSNDAIAFSSIGEITGSAVNNTRGSFKDYKPGINNYYRLKIENADGTIEYSSVVLIKRMNKLLVNITPNPTSSFINLQISTDSKEKISVQLFNNIGQRVMQSNLTLQPSISNSTLLNVAHLAKGSYQVLITNSNNTLKHAETIVIQ